MNSQQKSIFAVLGTLAQFNKSEFVDLLTECGIAASEKMSMQELIDLWIQNAHKKELIVGSAYFSVYHAKDLNFSGTGDINAEVRSVSRDLFSYFSSENYSNIDWSNVGKGVQNVSAGLKQGGWAGGLGAAVESVGQGIGQNQNRAGNNAGMDILNRQREARNQMIQSALAVEKARADAAALAATEERKKRTITIIAVSVSALALLGIGAYFYIKSRK